MRRLIHPLLLLTLLLGACSSGVSSPQPDSAPGSNPSDLPTTDTSGIPTVPVEPHIDQPPDGNAPTLMPSTETCAYMWATQSLNDLTLDFQAAIKNLNPQAEGYAYAFGEDCIYPSGKKTFGAMETDFNVTMPVSDVTDENALGEWIVSVMNVIDDLPAEKIAGPKPGRVTIYFISETDQKQITFYIDRYRTLDPGLNGLEIYQALLATQ
ncbi:MAG: hypothetical protein QM730_26465 [Anaerolineales bacterium]